MRGPSAQAHLLEIDYPRFPENLGVARRGASRFAAARRRRTPKEPRPVAKSAGSRRHPGSGGAPDCSQGRQPLAGSHPNLPKATEGRRDFESPHHRPAGGPACSAAPPGLWNGMESIPATRGSRPWLHSGAPPEPNVQSLSPGSRSRGSSRRPGQVPADSPPGRPACQRPSRHPGPGASGNSRDAEEVSCDPVPRGEPEGPPGALRGLQALPRRLSRRRRRFW
jgi:hypothetical protein